MRIDITGFSNVKCSLWGKFLRIEYVTNCVNAPIRCLKTSGILKIQLLQSVVVFVAVFVVGGIGAGIGGREPIVWHIIATKPCSIDLHCGRISTISNKKIIII